MWANLYRGDCAPSNAYCGGIEATHILNWSFDGQNLCNGGDIEHAWGVATANDWGAIECTLQT